MLEYIPVICVGIALIYALVSMIMLSRKSDCELTAMRKCFEREREEREARKAEDAVKLASCYEKGYQVLFRGVPVSASSLTPERIAQDFGFLVDDEKATIVVY